jgi:hypothetical protein
MHIYLQIEPQGIPSKGVERIVTAFAEPGGTVDCTSLKSYGSEQTLKINR